MSRWLREDKVGERPIEVGRICCVIWGETNYRKLVTIVDLIDRNRVLVDGTGLSNMRRQSFPMRRLQTTKFRIQVGKDVHPKLLRERLKLSGALKKYQNSAAGRRNACQKRREKMSDFQRWKLYYVKGQFKKAVGRELLRLRAETLQKRAKERGDSAEDVAKITPKALRERGRKRLETVPVLRRVVGKFKRKLRSKVEKRQRKNFKRVRSHARNFKNASRTASKKKGATAA